MSRPCAISTQASQVPQGSAVGPSYAVERTREQARGRGLAHAARPREDERLVDAAARDRVAQRLRDGLLPDHVAEALGAVLAREDDVLGHASRTSRLRVKADANPTAAREGLRHMSVTT